MIFFYDGIVLYFMTYPSLQLYDRGKDIPRQVGHMQRRSCFFLGITKFDGIKASALQYRYKNGLDHTSCGGVFQSNFCFEESL